MQLAKTSTRISWLSFALIATMYSCGGSDSLKSSKVDEINIFRSYTVTYDESMKSTSLLAQFREKNRTGSSITLESPSSIAAQDANQRFDGMSPRALSDGSGGYLWSTSEGSSSVYTLNWTTPSKRLVTDTLNLPTPVRPVLVNSSFSRSGGIVIRFDRELDASGMTVNANIKGLIEGSGVSATVTGSVTAGSSVQFSNADLQRFALGAITIEMQTQVEKSLPAITSSGVSGVGTSVYQLPLVTVSLTQ